MLKGICEFVYCLKMDNGFVNEILKLVIVFFKISVEVLEKVIFFIKLFVCNLFLRFNVRILILGNYFIVK